MRIILFELRKIFEWKRLLVCTFFCAIFAFLFLDFHFRFFPNGSEVHRFNIVLQMIDDYGFEMDESEFEMFQQQFEDQVAEFNAYLQTRADIQEAGITSFEDLLYSEEDSEIRERIAFEEDNLIFWELQARHQLIYEWRHIDAWYDGEFDTAIQPIFDFRIFENWQNIISWTALMIIFSVMIMISPLYLFERKNNMMALQYTTKLGRSLYIKKMIAVALATLIGITFQIGVIFVLYIGVNQTTAFFPIVTNSVWSGGRILRHDISFFHYILVTIGLVYVLGLMFSGISVFASRIAPNHLTVIALQIPLITVFQVFLSNVMIRNPLSNSSFVPHPAIFYLPLIFLVVVILLMQWRKEKKLDI